MEPPSNASGLRRRCSGAPSEMEPSSFRSNSDEVAHHHRQMKRPPFDAGKPPRLTTEGYHNYHHQIPCRFCFLHRLSRYLNRFRPLCLSRSLYSTCGSASGLDASFNADGDEGNGDEDNEGQKNDNKDNDDLGLDASFNADGDDDGDEDNEDQENDDKDNDDLVLLLPLSISGLLLFGFAISHGAEFRRLGLCVTVSLRQRQRQRGFGLGLRVITQTTV
ncbi:hypothetical protein LWI29_023776 [Acer saccharum]|uniref:Uncharacterized protein n=1 Tax=Acer saccharum TaxID=4024 RepID=A0AA39RXH0_ACESA|nr:hypothetical protein LWI29_023776 [Acer saccharum]